MKSYFQAFWSSFNFVFYFLSIQTCPLRFEACRQRDLKETLKNHLQLPTTLLQISTTVTNDLLKTLGNTGQDGIMWIIKFTLSKTAGRLSIGIKSRRLKNTSFPGKEQQQRHGKLRESWLFYYYIFELPCSWFFSWLLHTETWALIMKKG